MNWWFITILLFHALTLGVTTAEHGKPRVGKHHIGLTMVSVGISIFIVYMAIKTGF